MVPVWMTFSDLFKVTIIQRQLTWKLYNIQLYLQSRPLKSPIWSTEQRHFQWPWTTPTPSFKVTPIFDAEYLINGMTYRHSFNEILIGTYTCPTQQCRFEWRWVILSNKKCLKTLNSCAVRLLDISYDWPYRLLLFTSDKGGGICFCPHARVRLSVCLCATLLKNACMHLDEMLHVDRCRDMDELVNVWARSGS